MSGVKIYSCARAGRLLDTGSGFVPFRADRAIIAIWHDAGLGLLSVEHDGTLGFDGLQAAKNAVWGREAAAIEVYPPADRLVNNCVMRHLWRLGPDDFWPDLCAEGRDEPRRLVERYAREVHRS